MASSKGLPMTWSPIGSPASEKPQGTEIAGTYEQARGVLRRRPEVVAAPSPSPA